MVIRTCSSSLKFRDFLDHKMAQLIEYTFRPRPHGYNLKESFAADSLQIAQRIVIDTTGSSRGASA